MKSFVAVWMWFGRRPVFVFDVFATAVALMVACAVWIFGAERRFVLLTNLKLCFPDRGLLWRYVNGFQHMFIYVRTFLDRAWLWQAGAPDLAKRIEIQGLDRLQALAHQNLATSSDEKRTVKPVIILAPHFLGLDAGWTRLCSELSMVTMYSNQKNPILNNLLKTGRARIGEPVLLSRQEGVRGIIKNLKSGKPLYYLPDMDFGEKDAVFVPFFGVKAATVTAVARLARLTGATVVPCPTFWKRKGIFGGKYVLSVRPALENFPPEDDTLATTQINQTIEALVLEAPSQYLWTHKRFKTRPQGEPGFYGKHH
ncbi:MAG: lysophospholipid acyltransferase family protein [Burkholderiales bacterium]|nr:lysophospholipid acyltransferase family protein [Burkholderiales bacterium]